MGGNIKKLKRQLTLTSTQLLSTHTKQTTLHWQFGTPKRFKLIYKFNQARIS